MLHYIKGDLLKSDCTVIMHQANCKSTMGAGIAKFIKEKYPNAYKVDKESIYTDKEKYGKFTASKEENGITIVNLYGQFGLGQSKTAEEKKMREIMLRRAINLFLLSAQAIKPCPFDMRKVGLPYKMACGIAGGDWNVVEKILEEASELHKVDFYIYQLD